MNNKYDLNKFVFDFAAKYMPNYKQDGDNLRAQFCPLCNGGKSKDKNTFGINKFTSEYGCFRGGCKPGENTGNYKKLAERFGINMDYYLIDNAYKKTFQKTKRKIYKQPKNKVNEINNNLIEFFKKRGISKQTLELAKVKEVNNSVVFDYYDIENKIVNRKYRKIDKKEFMAEKDGKPIFYNMQNIDLNYPLTIVEGECFTGESEILTELGWIKLKNYENQLVMQYNENGTSNLVKPLAYIKKKYTGNLIEFSNQQKFYSLTTENHNIVLLNTKKQIIKKKANEIKISQNHIIRTTTHNGTGINLTDNEIRLCIAVSADFTIRKSGDIYGLLKKERKVKRICEILNALKIPFSNNKDCKNYNSIFIRRGDVPKYLFKLFPMEWITQSTIEQKKLIIDEILYWDGNNVPNRNQIEYSSKEIHNATFIQTISHLCGYCSTIISRKNQFGSWYKVSILFKKQLTSTQKSLKKNTHYVEDKLVYCVTVPSGMLIVRQNNCISISGNCDVLACIESGMTNAVSIPNGVNGLDCIELCWDWLEHFKKIIIFVDLDESAEECREKLIERLGDWRCYIVNKQCECCKDANDILLKHGKEKVIEAIETAKEIPNEQLITIDQIKKINYDDIKRIKTGFIELDKLIGGFECGFLNILTGESGAGKSTLLNQFILEAIQNQMKVMCYSAELKAHKFLRWLTLSAAINKDNLISKYGRITNELFYEVKYSVYKKIFDWLLPNFYFLETKTIDEITESQILNHMSYAFKKYNCEFFVLDNLMTIDLEIIRETELLSKQKKFISKLKNFAATNNVIIILVAHPKKINYKQKKITKDDISGSGNIFNIADTVLSLYRPQLNKDSDEDFDNCVDVLKNREKGKYGTISLNFDENSKRFIEQSGIQSKYYYNWMEIEEKQIIENEKILEEIPF